jgi:hypothetical protein
MATWTNSLTVLDKSTGILTAFAPNDQVVTGADFTFSDSVVVQGDVSTNARLVSKAGVSWMGIGQGQVVIQGVGPILAITHAGFYRNLDFDVTDAAALVTVTGDNLVVLFEQCTFEGNGNNGNAVTVTSGAIGPVTAAFDRCVLNQTVSTFRILNATNNGTGNAAEISIYRSTYFGSILLTDSGISARQLDGTGSITSAGTAGLGTVLFQDCRLVSTGTCYDISVVSGIMDLFVEHTYFSGILGINFLGSTAGDCRLDGNHFNCTSWILADAVAVTADVFQGNTGTGNGVILANAGTFIHRHPIKHVGGTDDAFNTLQGALSAVTTTEETILLHKDITLTGAVTVTVSTNPLIDGQNQYQINRGAGLEITNLAASTSVSFTRVRLVGKITVNGDGAGVNLLDRTIMTGLLDVVAGDATSFVYIYQASVTGDVTDLYCIRLLDADPLCTIKRSYLKGVAANAAIYYDTATNNKLKICYSTVMHGSLAANLPIARSGAQTPTFASNNDSYNIDPTGGGWLTNSIAANQNVYDVAADY